MGSSAPSDTNNLFWKRRELKAVKHNVAPVWLNPLNLHNVHWSEGDAAEGDMYSGEMRGEHTQKWRSDPINKMYSVCTSQEAARNIDIDPLAVAGGKVFLNYSSKRCDGEKILGSPTWDLWTPDLPLQVWYDVGRGDPWAFWWVQVDFDEGWVNVVDFTTRDTVTVHWFIPMLLGWNFDGKDRWITAPERMPWRDAVPWMYDADEEMRIRRWYSRRGVLGGQIEQGFGCYFGTHSHGGDNLSIEQRFMEYKLPMQSFPAQYKMGNWIEQADEVLLRTRISGFLIDKRPQNGMWPACNEIFTFWRRGESKESTMKPSEPLHDAYSHGGTAWVFGARWLPMLVQAKMRGGHSREVIAPGSPVGKVEYSERGWFS